VPALAAVLASHGVRASFFVACGPDRMVSRLGRLRDPRFVWKLLRTRAVRTYGWRTLLSGSLLPARPVAGSFPDLLRKLVAAGHEVGVHGWDHARWQDKLPALDAAEVHREVEQATATYRSAVGASPLGFAAPGWRCTAASLGAVDAAGFAYRSDTRGTAPYIPAAGGRAFRAPEIPTTLPTLDEIYGTVSRSSATLAEHHTRSMRRGTLNVLTMHAELEGGPHIEFLELLLARVTRMARLVRLCDEAAALVEETLPTCAVMEGTVRGRAMPVAVQGPVREWPPA